MIKWIFIAGVAFTIGGMIWPFIDWPNGDPKFYYIPLSAMMLLCFIKIKNNKVTAFSEKEKLFLDALFLLSVGFVIKQVFYTSNPAVYIRGYRMPIISLVNDYCWGLLVYARLIYKLWAIRKRGKK